MPDEDGTSVADAVEARADRLAERVAVVDALQDHGELERRRTPCTRQTRRRRAPSARRTARSARPVRVPGRRGRRADGESGRPSGTLYITSSAEVGERVAERGHLPVQDGLDPVVLADEDVVEPVVAVHDRGRRGRLRAAARPSAACSSSMPASSRLREASNCLPQRRSCRSRNPSGRPKSARPTAAGSTACSSTSVSTRRRNGAPGCAPGRAGRAGRPCGTACPPRTP